MNKDKVLERFLEEYPDAKITFKKKEVKSRYTSVIVKDIHKTVSEETLIKAIEKEFSDKAVDTRPGPKHGKVVRILRNTHSIFTIIIFELGNQFLTDIKLDSLVGRYFKGAADN